MVCHLRYLGREKEHRWSPIECTAAEGQGWGGIRTNLACDIIGHFAIQLGGFFFMMAFMLGRAEPGKLEAPFSSEDISGQNQVKASVQRRIRQSIADEYPSLEPLLDDLLPKKSPMIVVKCQNHLNLVVVNNVPLFFNIRDGPYMPTLRLLHQYPDIMKKFQVDRGAIKFVLSGANIMCPGLTSPGGVLDDEVEEETPVAIMAEGKQHALAIGFTKMSAKDIKTINKGIGVDNMHYLNDGLWKMEKLE
ncbi:Malignant T-cell-amplified sequence 1 [Dichanthelium oligosanthes]|uniref:Malignant T-cell-amplified sequence 1 n=1 Tax=Dichanthelium oligosanthes TaxID=888268 RepID=A0A1E5WEJ9_9POAL|nr:Malignant T-cell-amplified sequence 1 [Dichanthelium oligosanthes]